MNSIYISDQGELILIDAPNQADFIEWSGHESKDKLDKEAYDSALASAINEGIKFKDKDATWTILLYPDHIDEYSIGQLNGKIFPLPTDYKVIFENNCESPNACGRAEFCLEEADGGTCTAQKLAILSKLEEEKCSTCGGKRDENMYCSNSFHLVAPSEEVKQNPETDVSTTLLNVQQFANTNWHQENIWDEAEEWAWGELNANIIEILKNSTPESQIKIRTSHVIDALKTKFLIARKPV